MDLKLIREGNFFHCNGCKIRRKVYWQDKKYINETGVTFYLHFEYHARILENTNFLRTFSDFLRTFQTNSHENVFVQLWDNSR